MDKILLKNLAFYGYHGVMSEENKLGQKFFLDVELYVDLKNAGMSDSVTDTVHYGEVYQLVKDIVVNQKFNLIETLAETIASNILNVYNLVLEVKVTVRKPEAPVDGIYDYFGVEIRRRRDA